MKKDHTAFLGLIMFIMLALPVFCVSHDTFAAASTITLTIDDSLVDMNITSTSPNGNFNKSNPSTITVSTTNATGYTLSIAATGGTDSNNPTKLVNTSENTALDSVSSAVTESDFKAANSTSYNNKWGFLPSKFNSVDNTSFLPSPTTVADDSILNQTSTANSTADTYTVSIGARIDHTTKAGSYNNTFVIYATANAIPYTITYDDGIVSNMPTDVAGETNESTVAISENVPTRTGYTFLGWCTVQPTNNNGTDVCTGGTEYNPGDSLAINPSGSNNFRLYAMWGLPCASSQYIMQNVSQWGSSVTSGNEITVCDNRDGKTYTVARLADNNLWMTQNLDFDITNNGANLNSTNTDVPSNWADAGNLANTHATDDTTWDDTSTGYTIPESYNPGDAYWNGDLRPETQASCEAAGGTWTESGSCKNADLTSPTGNSHYHLGNYYNWTAAVAMANSSSYTQYADANQSICPAGWMLPKSGNNTSSGSFRYLIEQYGWNSSTYVLGNGAKMWDTPFHISLSGMWSGSLENVGIAGYYWSPVVNSNIGSYGLSPDYYSTIFPADGFVRYAGFTIRCVVR